MSLSCWVANRGLTGDPLQVPIREGGAKHKLRQLYTCRTNAWYDPKSKSPDESGL